MAQGRRSCLARVSAIRAPFVDKLCAETCWRGPPHHLLRPHIYSPTITSIPAVVLAKCNNVPCVSEPCCFCGRCHILVLFDVFFITPCGEVLLFLLCSSSFPPPPPFLLPAPPPLPHLTSPSRLRPPSPSRRTLFILILRGPPVSFKVEGN